MPVSCRKAFPFTWNRAGSCGQLERRQESCAARGGGQGEGAGMPSSKSSRQNVKGTLLGDRKLHRAEVLQRPRWLCCFLGLLPAAGAPHTQVPMFLRSLPRLLPAYLLLFTASDRLRAPLSASVSSAFSPEAPLFCTLDLQADLRATGHRLRCAASAATRASFCRPPAARRVLVFRRHLEGARLLFLHPTIPRTFPPRSFRSLHKSKQA